MPCSPYASGDSKEDEYFAIEDFLHAIVNEGNIKGRLEELCGLALISKTGSDPLVQWGQVVELSLFKTDILSGNELKLSASCICEALFYGIHILIARSLSKLNTIDSDSVFLLVFDSKFGGVVKLGGDLSRLELKSTNPYHSVIEWIKCHAEVRVSSVERVWNKLGNANWGDLGTLQVLLATFYSIVQWNGPPRKSIASLASDHSLRLQKRRIECCLSEGEVLLLEDQQQGHKSFQIQNSFVGGNYLLYSAVYLDNPTELLTLYVGAHPRRLEPCWEDMSLWYQVQRQTKVLNILKQRGITSKYLPEIVASGRILHPGPCKKQSPGGCCDHPWCGTPILVTSPVGEQLSFIVAQDGSFSSEEAVRCCRDCLAALRSATMAGVQHGDICPENIIRVMDSRGINRFFYMPISWGRAVLEDRDSPGLNLHMQQQDSIEAALQWRERSWAKRLIQQQLGEVSALLKAFADYVDSLCGTPYPVDYDVWLKRLNRAVGDSADRGKMVQELSITLRLEDVAECSRASGGGI
ncbi:hypothetical protein GH714_003915 [Hevea brasiliensis]|uniref:Protein kinase domain-containing protein n=1 Tax=Hevea brasiliensis TaxID=3981 RepID=A0A6A6K7H8_HEVBR|nr:hypothetical protein GH714_003915 [Hevea brasiliensis]